MVEWKHLISHCMHTKNTKQSIHFIGIGGIGMSSLAQYFLARGAHVTGSDLKGSEITALLEEKGATIRVGPHTGRNIPQSTERIIISAAIDAENAEYKAAKKRKIPVRTYAEAVGELTRSYRTIAVSGAHGKSTTTALSALTLERAGMDPVAIVGTRLHEWRGANFRMGRGDYLVLEADEYAGAFRRYIPTIIIATNIDREHLDYFKTFNNVKKAFSQFFASAPRGTTYILNRDDPHLWEIGKGFSRGKKVIWYSLSSADAEKIAAVIQTPGRHSVSNALAVLALARVLNIPESIVMNVLQSYRGSWRRAEYKGRVGGAAVYDDYAHHPTEIRATLAGFREMNPTARIWCVFQPHQQRRLELLFDDFVSAFHHADRIVLLEPYRVPGRETNEVTRVGKKIIPTEEGHTVFDLAAAIDRVSKKIVFHIQYPSELKAFIATNVLEGDIVIMMGAGNINELTPQLLTA